MVAEMVLALERGDEPSEDLRLAVAAGAAKALTETAGRTADAKSILQVLTLGVRDGAEIIVRAEGEGEDAALRAITALFGDGPAGTGLWGRRAGGVFVWGAFQRERAGWCRSAATNAATARSAAMAA